MMEHTVLVLDDQKSIRQHFERFLSLENYTVYTADNIESATEIIRVKKIDFALIDLKIDYKGDYGGIAMIEELNRRQPRTKIIIGTAYELDDELKRLLSGVEYFEFVCKGGSQSYFEAVIETLKKARNQPAPKKCFVIMPFSDTPKCSADEWTDIFENTIKPAVEDSGFPYTCYKANLSIGNIIVDILDNLNKADVVIADLTDRNPNVYYELGVRHALRNATLLITQSLDDVPFDLRPYALMVYDWKTKKGREQFFAKMKDALQAIEANGKHVASPVQDYLKLTV